MLAFLIGAMAIVFNFSLPVMNGAPGEVFQFDNEKVLVIEAYFNTCPYCNDNAANVDDLAEEFSHELRLKVVDVGIDRKTSDYQAWISKHNPNHPVLMDSNKKLISQLGTSSYPSTYVIDCQGNVKFRSVGVWSSLTKERIKAAIDAGLDDCK